jgi:hypothetical protein
MPPPIRIWMITESFFFSDLEEMNLLDRDEGIDIIYLAQRQYPFSCNFPCHCNISPAAINLCIQIPVV